ncbi:MAG TPA: PAS domain S-box protein, partial [Gammaproteobacteria bacterium]
MRTRNPSKVQVPGVKLASAFNGSSSLVALTRLADGRFVDVNDGFERTLGFTRDKLIGRTAVEVGIWDADKREHLLQELRDGQQITARSVTIRRSDGSGFEGLLNAAVVTVDGEHYVLGILDDVQQRAAGRSAERRAEARYRSIFDHAVEAIYQSTPDGRCLDANPALARLLGYASPQELMKDVGDMGHELYADPKARAELTALLRREGRFENRQMEVRRRDGSLMWVSENAHAVKGESGELLYYEGSFVDVGARHAAELALQISEEKYRTLVDHSQDGVFITQEGNYTYVNQAYAAMLGYTAA